MIIDSVVDDYAAVTTTKSTFKPMPFVRAGESLSSMSAAANTRKMEDSDEEEDVKLHTLKKKGKISLNFFFGVGFSQIKRIKVTEKEKLGFLFGRD